MPLREDTMEEVASNLAEIIRKLRAGENVGKDEIEALTEKVSGLDDPLLKRHLLTLLWEIEKGERGEGDILEKLISYDSSDLSNMLKALQEFSYDEPFDELELKETFELWRSVLRNLSKEGRSSRGANS